AARPERLPVTPLHRGGGSTGPEGFRSPVPAALRSAGEMWRGDDHGAQTVVRGPGPCLTIPVGTAFQFRCTSNDPLAVFGVTMPPWPGDGEAIRADGPWPPTLVEGPGLARR